MAGITFYDAYFPTIISSITALEAILLKGQAHAKENGIDADAEYVTARLHEDMKPLSYQIQIASNMVKKCAQRVGGSAAAAEEWADDETTLDQLLARTRRTAELLKSVRPEDVNGKEGDVIEVQLGPVTKNIVSLPYVTSMILPNLFFHVQTTYSILRMKGVPLGKTDFLMPYLGAHLQ